MIIRWHGSQRKS